MLACSLYLPAVSIVSSADLLSLGAWFLVPYIAALSLFPNLEEESSSQPHFSAVLFPDSRLHSLALLSFFFPPDEAFLDFEL